MNSKIPDNIVLRVSKICKSFPGVKALDNVDFELREGEVHVLLGENGAGKSTLVKIISGAIPLSGGIISLFENEVVIKSPKHAQEMGIATIYQELNLIPSLSASENIFLGRETTNRFGLIKKINLLSSSKRILDDLGLEIDCQVQIKNFGIAQQQMIEVAKALSMNARILIMDEPTSALSETEIQLLFKTIRGLTKKGVSVIYISHRLNELFEIGDRVTVLRDGKLIGTKRIADITKDELIKMMVNRDLREHYPKLKTDIGKEVLRVEKLSSKGKLKNISFVVNEYEILGIAGLLGSGRTELARAVFAADKFDSGKIFIRGKLQTLKSPRAVIKNGIGFVTEDRKAQGLILSLSVKENITLSSLKSFSKFGFINFKKEKEEADRFINEIKIKTINADQKVYYLSGGNQQKVALAKWLCMESNVLIFDEPTRGIDIGSKIEIYSLMNRLKSEGSAIIMISSELPELIGICDRIIVMHRHQIAGEVSSSEATQESIMRYAVGA